MIAEVFAAVRLALLADSTVNALCGGQIFANKAEQGGVMPYLIISLPTGQTRPQTLGRDTSVLDINIKAVGSRDEKQDAAVTDLAREIRRVLHRCYLTIPGYEFYEMKHRTPFYFTEIVEKKEKVYAGGLYRLEIDEVIA